MDFLQLFDATLNWREMLKKLSELQPQVNLLLTGARGSVLGLLLQAGDLSPTDVEAEVNVETRKQKTAGTSACCWLRMRGRAGLTVMAVTGGRLVQESELVSELVL